MKKRIVLSLFVICVTVSGTFLATRAFFRDTETGTGSKITAGTLDLEVGGANGTNIEPFIVANIGAEGNVSGTKSWTVKNTGTLPGRLYFRLQDLLNDDNGCNEPEALVDTTCADPGQGEGDLGKVLVLKVYLDNQLVATTNLDTANQDAVKTVWNAFAPVVIPAGQSKIVKLDYSAGENDYGNEVQSDSVSFNTRFDLVQLTNAVPTP